MHSISLIPVGDIISGRSGETVLAAILRSGASVAFGCRAGGCGVCKMRLTSGQVDHGRCSASVLTGEEKESGLFLSCQAAPLSDLTIELTQANKYRVLTVWQATER